MAKRKPKPEQEIAPIVATASDRAAVEQGCKFDPGAARRPIEFFARFLRHGKGEWAGKPFELLPWQTSALGQIFGWLRPDGTRRFRRAYIEVPKKNGKSTMGSGIGLYMLLADDEPGAEVYSAAVDREQASIVHGEAVRMVKSSSALLTRLKLNDATKRISDPATSSWYAALAAEAAGSEGKNAHCVIKDELHVWQHKREFYESLRYAGAARRQPLDLSITTAGTYDAIGVGWQEHEYAAQVLSGAVIDISYFALIAAAEQTDDWTSPDVWRKANPSWGVTVQESEMAQACAEAQRRPSMENAFRRYRLNQWTEQTSRWLSVDAWLASPRIDPRELAGRDCWAGMDLSATSDVTAFVLAFPLDAGGFAIVPQFWIPEEAAVDRQRRNRGAYCDWGRAGQIVRCPGRVVDYGMVRAAIRDLAAKYRIVEIAYDPWNATQVATDLDADGMTMVQFRQGFASMNEPTKEFERLVVTGGIHHTGNPAMDWMVSNVTVSSDPAGNLKPDKAKSGDKIDGVVAAIMAIARARSANNGASVYDDMAERPGGLVFI